MSRWGWKPIKKFVNVSLSMEANCQSSCHSLCAYIYRGRHRQTDTQTYRQTDLVDSRRLRATCWAHTVSQTHIETDRQTDTDTQTDLVTFREIEGDTPSVLDRFTNQSISTRKQQCLLDARRVITDYIHNQLDVLRIFYLPVQYMHRPHRMTEATPCHNTRRDHTQWQKQHHATIHAETTHDDRSNTVPQYTQRPHTMTEATPRHNTCRDHTRWQKGHSVSIQQMAPARPSQNLLKFAGNVA